MKLTRYFTAFVYADQCERDDLISRLHDWDFIKGFAISPLHDDVENHHYHLILRTCEETSALSLRTHCQNNDSLCGLIYNAAFQPVISLSGISNYLCHTGDPRKKQFSLDDVYTFNVPKVDKVLYGDKKCLYFDDFMSIVQNLDITDYVEFQNYLYVNRDDLDPSFRCWCIGHYGMISHTINSRRHYLKDNYYGMEQPK